MCLPLFISDSLGLLIEPEKLILSVLDPSVEMNPSSTVTSHDSSHWHVRSNVEWSVDVETELFIESLSFNLSSIVEIDDLPFLVKSIVVSSNGNWSSFFILVSFNIDDLSILSNIDELSCSVLEDLEPL